MKVNQKKPPGFQKGIKNSHYRHGYSLREHFCKCGNKIDWRNALKGSGMCRPCSRKEEYKNPENHPNYIDGRSFEPYPKEFNEELREEIRSRDNYTCQGENCGITNEEHLVIYDQSLHVHHVDYNKKNCNKTNLISTCQQCNLKANYNRDYWYAYYRYKLDENKNIQR